MAGLLRGWFWAVAVDVWSPVDEAQHFAYVASLSRGDMPVVGRDRVPPEVLEVALARATGGLRGQPFRPDPADPRWGAMAQQYEAGQPPLYYVLMAPASRAGALLGTREAILVTRGASVLASLLAVVVAYALARELFPGRPAVWVAAPAALVLVAGFNSNLATVTNDALVPATAAAMIPTARALRRGLTHRRALATGLLLGAGVLVKTTALPVVVVVGSAVVVAAAARHVRRTDALRWLGVAAAVTVSVPLPWMLWNLTTYGSPSALEPVMRTVTGPLQPPLPLTLHGVWEHVQRGISSFWNGQVVPNTTLVASLPLDPHTLVWWVAVAGAGLAGGVAAWRRRARAELAAVAWLAASFPLTMVTFLAVVYVALEGARVTVGRMLYASLVPLVVLLAGGMVVALGRRVGVAVLVGVAALALSLEPGHVRSYTDLAYTGGLYRGLTPVVDQWRNDGWHAGGTIVLHPPCAAEAVGIIFEAEPPAQLTATLPSGRVHLRYGGRPTHDAGPPVGVYPLLEPTTAAFTVDLPPTVRSGRRGADPSPHLAVRDGNGDPTARIYCRTATPAADRFSQTYAVNHPGAVTLGMLRAWPVAWMWLGGLSVLVAVAWVVLHRRASW